MDASCSWPFLSESRLDIVLPELFLVAASSGTFVAVAAALRNSCIWARVYECMELLYDERDMGGDPRVEFDE